MAIRKTVTPKQMEANRRNALQSTGPKTASGKKAAARNAMEHGLLASEIVIDGGAGQEHPAEFAALLQGLRDDFSPRGTLEEMLVERVAVSYWRLRRALRCETGETRKRLDSVIGDQERNRDTNFYKDVYFCALDPSGAKLKASSKGVSYLIKSVKLARSEVETKGQISEVLMKLLSTAFGDQLSGVARQISVLNEDIKKAKTGGSPSDLEVAKRKFMELSDNTVKDLERLIPILVRNEHLFLQARIRSLSLPPPQVLDRIIRYETTIERQLYRALDQLERIQRQRKGDHISAPLRVSIE